MLGRMNRGNGRFGRKMFRVGAGWEPLPGWAITLRGKRTSHAPSSDKGGRREEAAARRARARYEESQAKAAQAGMWAGDFV